MSAQRGLVSQAANAGSFEGTSVTTCVTKRKDPQHTVLACYSSTLKAHFILRGILINHRYCSFSSFSMDLTEVSQRTDEK